MKEAEKNKTENEPAPAQKGKLQKISIFALTNRGMLLDVFVFIANLFLMRWLARLFIDTARAASDGDFFSSLTMFLFCLAIFVLPPLGATLKRWHFHQRLRLKGKNSVKPENLLGGCLFNPIFYFCLNAIIFSALNAFVMNFLYEGKEPDGAVFVSSILFGIVLMLFQTIIVYRYFSPPKTAPQSEFLKSPTSERFGDACIFLNMILYQVLWNILTAAMPPRPPNVSILAEIGFRFFFIFFVSLFVYFPPRIFYLAEDIGRRRVWLTILLANSPLIFRVLYGAA